MHHRTPLPNSLAFRLNFNSVINMEISRLIFITLLITCCVVMGHSDCDEETISKLPDDQCLSDLDESELVITTATETKNADLFTSETTTPIILVESITTHNDHKVITEVHNIDHPIQSEVRESDIKSQGNPNNIISTSSVSSLKQLLTEEDIIHEDISTHPITETLIASKHYPATEEPKKATSELYFNENSLLSEINTESLDYYRSKSEESSTELNSPRIIVDKNSSEDHAEESITDVTKIEEARLESSDLVMKIFNGGPIKKHVEGLHETVSDSNDEKLDKLNQSHLKVDGSIDNSLSKPSIDFGTIEKHVESLHDTVSELRDEKSVQKSDLTVNDIIDNISSKQSIDSDSVKDEGRLHLSNDLFFNRKEEIIEDSNNNSDLVAEVSNDERRYEFTNDEEGMNGEVFPKHSFNDEAYDPRTNYSNSERKFESSDDDMDSEVHLRHSFNNQADDTRSNHSTNAPSRVSEFRSKSNEQVMMNDEFIRNQQNKKQALLNHEPPRASELSSRNVQQVMMDDEFMRNQQNQKQALLNHEPPRASELSSRNVQQVMMDDEFIRNKQIEQLQNQKVEQGGNEPCAGCDLGILPVTTAAGSGSKGTIENSPFRQSHAIPEASIQFAEVPPEKDLRVDDLGLGEGSFLFGYLGELLSWLQPNDFPVELMRNALRNQISIIDLITQSLKLEAGFIGCIVIGVSLALAAPIVVLAHTCYRIRRKGDEGDQTPIGCAGNCRRRTLVFFLQIIIFLLLIGTAAMLITNQQVSTAVLQTSDVLKTVLDDLDTFLHNVHHQLHFAVSKHLDQAVQAVNSDLDNVEILLGQPIQTELSKETGLDVALESLRDIAQDVSKVGDSVELVQLAAGLLSEGIIMTSDKLSDLRLQVNSFRRQCSSRDRPLCDTLNIAGLEVTLRVDSLRQDDKLNRVRQIGGPELRGAVESARVLFRDIPRQVAVDTKDSREAVRRQLNQEQMNIDENIRSLEILVRNLKGKLTTGQNMLDDVAVDIPELEFWRWMIGLGAAGSLALLWVLLQLGISCGCCGSEKSAGPTLLICVILICLLSTVLWLLAIIVFVIGGHGQAFICRPLYQEPEFPALSQLLDNPGLFPNSHKFISSLAFDNDTIDVPFNKVLRECHENKPVYPVFKLNGVFNIETMTESKKWDKFHDKLNEIKVKLNHLKVLSPTLQNQLNDLLQGLSVNLTAHRTYLSSSVTGRDLTSFAAQLESVGNQIKDLATASRMETLASRTRRLIATHIEPLKEKKNNLLYQLTTLEVQLNPLQRQVEQSISHFKTIQFFIDNQGNSIANKKVKEYTHRLMKYIHQYKNNLADRINNNLARCQPLWKLFNISRLMLCKHVMDPLNGFWFSTVCCLIILLCATPVCLKLVDCYKKKSQVSNYNSGSPTENLVSNESGRDWSSSNGTNDSGGGW